MVAREIELIKFEEEADITFACWYQFCQPGSLKGPAEYNEFGLPMFKTLPFHLSLATTQKRQARWVCAVVGRNSPRLQSFPQPEALLVLARRHQSEYTL